MNSWRDRIVRKLEAAPGRLTLVADPDDLLLEEPMLQRIEPTSMPSSRPSSAIRSPSAWGIERLGAMSSATYSVSLLRRLAARNTFFASCSDATTVGYASRRISTVNW